MKSLLILTWLLVGGAGYFGYKAYQQAVVDGQTSAAALEAEKAANADLTAKIGTLNASLAALQNQLAAPKAPAETPAVVAVTPAAAPVPAPPAAPDLGNTPTSIPATITTAEGKTYTECVLSRVTPDGISFTHSMGVAKVLFSDLDPAFAAKFGYNADAAKKYEQDEAAREAQSDSIRVEQVKTQSQATVALASTEAQSTSDAQAARKKQIQALQDRIDQLSNEASTLEAQDSAAFNSPMNEYVSRDGALEHRNTMEHNPQALQDRAEIASLQLQISELKAAP